MWGRSNLPQINLNVLRIVELYVEKEISKLQRDDTFGFEDDSIFLLSKEEYEQYKDQIPQINCWWWLRSPGYFSCNVAGVNSDGSISNYGDCVHHMQKTC